MIATFAALFECVGLADRVVEGAPEATREDVLAVSSWLALAGPRPDARSRWAVSWLLMSCLGGDGAAESPLVDLAGAEWSESMVLDALEALERCSEV